MRAVLWWSGVLIGGVVILIVGVVTIGDPWKTVGWLALYVLGVSLYYQWNESRKEVKAQLLKTKGELEKLRESINRLELCVARLVSQMARWD